MTARELIDALGLQPHPEGGYYVETWRADAGGDGRAAATAIYFLLEADDRSHWHRVDADEVWLHHAGAAVRLSIATDATAVDHVLGSDVAVGERPQVRVPAGAWQSAVPIGGWALVSCVVVPGFEFDGFELASPGWSPSPARDRSDR